MDQIKLAFQRVKEDIDSMQNEINELKYFLTENREQLINLEELIHNLTLEIAKLNLNYISNPPISSPAHDLQIPTTPTNNPAHNLPFEALKHQNLGISTGNEGVPADRQTNQQTDQHIENTSFGDALNLLNSLDNIKKEIKNKFKKITDQEFLVFSTIYQLSEETGYTDYKTLSQKLNLTESSIRDYVGKLIQKGIPVEKIRLNNKLIQLFISEKLKKIAPLSVIFQLRTL